MKLPILIVCCLVTSALAQGNSPAVVSVSGSAEVRVAPDEVLLTVGVESRDSKLEVAKKQNDESIAATIKALKDGGIDSKDIQTDFVRVDPEFDGNISRVNPTHYTVTRNIGVRIRKVDSFEKLLTAVIRAGVNRVYGIDFRTTELRKHRDKARQMAIQAAKEKADLLSKELDVKLGKVYNISENSWGGYWQGSRGNWAFQNVQVSSSIPTVNGEGSEEGPTLSVGQISVNASVSVSFLIE